MDKPKLWTKEFTILMAVNMLYLSGFFMLLPTVPLFLLALGREDMVGAVAAAFTATAIAMRFCSPYFLRKLGKIRMLRLGVGLAFLSTALFGLADEIGGVFVFRVLQGMGFGMVSTICGALAADLLPDSRRGEGISYFSMGVTVVVAFAPALGLFLSRRAGFETMFLVASFGKLMALILLGFFKPPKRLGAPQKGEKRASLIVKPFGSLLKLQCGLLVLFGIARSAEQNLLPILAEGRGIDLSLYFILQTAVAFFIKYATGRVYDASGHRWCVLPGAAALFCSLVVMSAAQNLSMILLAAVFTGIGMGALLTSMQTWTIAKSAPERRSMASMAYFNAYDVGITMGSLALGGLVTALGYTVTFRTASLSMILFIIVYLLSQMSKNLKGL